MAGGARELGIELRFRADSAQAKAAIKGVADKLKLLPAGAREASSGFAAAWKSADQSVTNWSSSMKVQMGMAGALGAMALFVKSSVTSLAEFEDAMIGVQKTTGMAAPEIKTLGDALRKMAVDDMQGTVAATELAKIAEIAGQMGVNSSEDILKFSKTIAEISIATDTSADEVAKSMGEIENVFRDSLQESGQKAIDLTANIGSAVDRISDETNASVRDVMELTRRMSGAASTIKMSVAETVALAGTLRDAGVGVEVGGTAMTTFMLELVKDSASFADAFKLDADALATALKTNPIEAIKMVLDGMDQMAQAQGPAELARVLEDVGLNDKRMVDALLKMSGNTAELEDNVRKSTESFEEGTRAHEAFLIAASSTEKQWTAIGEKSREAMRGFGEELKPATVLLTTWANGGLDVVIDASRSWKGGVKEEFFDGILDMFSGNRSAWATWGNEVKNVNSTTFASLSEIAKTSVDSMGSVFGTVFHPLTDPITEAKEYIDKEFGAISDTVRASVEMITSTFSDITEGLVAPFRDASATITGLLEKIPGFGPQPEPVKIDFSQPLDALELLRTKHRDLITTQDGLLQSVQSVFVGYAQAAKQGAEPTKELQAELVKLQAELVKVGIIAYGHSVFPEMVKAQEEARAAAAELTGQMTVMQGEVAKVGAAYETARAKVVEQEAAIKSLNDKILALDRQAANASAYRAKQIEKIIKQLELQKKSHQGVLDALKDEERAAKDAYKEQERGLKDIQKEQERATQEVDRYTIAIADATATLMEQSAEHIRARQATERYNAILNDVYRTTGQAENQTEDYIMSLEDLQNSLKSTGNAAQSMIETLSGIGDKLGGLGGNLGNLGDLLGISELGDAGNIIGQVQQYLQIPKILSEMGGQVKGVLSGLGSILGGAGGLGGIVSSVTGALGGLGGAISGAVGSLGGLAAGALGVLGPVGLVGGAIAGLINLFKDYPSEGNKAAAAMRDFVNSGIQGGAELAAAMGANYAAMKAAGFDYQNFLQQTGTTMDAVFGGISQNWQEGATAMDIFTQAVGAATGNMEKAPQVALQMVASFQDMGLSAEEAGMKMLEIAKAAGMSETQIQALQSALGGVQAQLSGAGEEGQTTTTIFDEATAKSALLTGQTNQLSGSLAQVTGQLMGAGAEGLTASNVFTLTSGSAQQLAGMTTTLASQVGNFTRQMSGAGAETIIASGLLNQAGISADDLNANTETLGNGLTALTENLSSSTQQTQELVKALKEAAKAAAALDDELVGHSVVPSLGKLFEVSRRSAGALERETGVVFGMAAATRDLDTAVKRANQTGMFDGRLSGRPGIAPDAFAMPGTLIIRNEISGNYLSPDLDLNWLSDEMSVRLEPKIRAVLRRI